MDLMISLAVWRYTMKENGVQSVTMNLARKKLRSSVKVLDIGECFYL